MVTVAAICTGMCMFVFVQVERDLSRCDEPINLVLRQRTSTENSLVSTSIEK